MDQVLRIEKVINADRARLFRAWLEPKDLARWFISGDSIALGDVSLDPRPGGRFRIDMIVNGVVRPHEGEYLEMDEPSKLVFTWRSHATGGRNTRVTVTFSTLSPGVDRPDGKPATLVTLVHEFLEGDLELGNHRHGWTSILTGLDQWSAR